MSLAELTNQMEENNRATYEVERHTRNARAHLLEIKKTMAVSVETQSIIALSINNLVEVLTGNRLAELEEKREMLRLLQGLGSNNDDKEGPDQFQGPDGTGSLMALGTGLAAAALALGASLGMLQGQVKAIKAYTKALTPASFTDLIDDMKKSWKTRIASVRIGINTRITSLGTSIGLLLDDFKGKFAINPDSVLGKQIGRVKGIFSILGQRIKNIITPISTASTIIKDSIMGPANKVRFWFNSVAAKVKRFGGIVTKIAGVVGKVFAPIAIVTTAWETITGIIEGWKEEGFLGGLKGGIEGFATSLITIPLDLVKDLVAWVLEKFGFDKEAELLKDFSFTTLFTNMLDGLFQFISSAVDWVKTLFTDPVTAIKTLWQGLYGEEGIINTIVWKPISKAVNWIMEKFSWKDDDPNAPDFDLYTYVGEVWNDVVDKVKQGFEDFGNWVASIPAKLKLMAVKTIDAATPDWLIDMSDDIAAAEAAVAAYSVPTSGAELATTEATIADTVAANAGMNGPPGTGGNSTVQLGGDSLTVATGTPKAASSESGLPQDIYGGFGNMTLEQIQSMSGG
jgi:hypothetical protein